MAYEPHPYPKPRFWRIAPPLTAAALAATGFLVMLALPSGPARTAALVVVLVAQVALMAGRGIVLHSSGRATDGTVYWHQFFFAWSFFAGCAHLLERDGTVEAVFNVVGGLVFAALLTSAVLAMSRAPERLPRP